MCHAQYVEGWELVYICECWEAAKSMGECLASSPSLPRASVYYSPSPPPSTRKRRTPARPSLRSAELILNTEIPPYFLGL